MHRRQIYRFRQVGAERVGKGGKSCGKDRWRRETGAGMPQAAARIVVLVRRWGLRRRIRDRAGSSQAQSVLPEKRQ